MVKMFLLGLAQIETLYEVKNLEKRERLLFLERELFELKLSSTIVKQINI
jgi:hypothetical protein